ncbi:MAG: methyltransferase domain-containing protein [Planctomycetes bacterium]|nr:methyltransferase domain-containing protein [Planctomycetota bacterium]MCB9905508.1 methyltransferase domain-containing protein [Planctomycetota bacterium]
MKVPPARRAAIGLAGLALVACSTLGCSSTRPAPPAPPEEASVKPGINDNFLDPELDVDKFVERFEGESREVFANRAAIVEAIGVRPGSTVADVGAGTGAYTGLFAEAVGLDGTVYALDIAPNFVEHLERRATEEGHLNVVAQLCSERSVDLPPNSIDLAFICDVYHHFEFPRSTMHSLHEALREGGEVVIVDFERIPGVSREWVLGHVRAGKQEVFAELDSYGFDLVEELEFDGLQENWVGRFRKR